MCFGGNVTVSRLATQSAPYLAKPNIPSHYTHMKKRRRCSNAVQEEEAKTQRKKSACCNLRAVRSTFPAAVGHPTVALVIFGHGVGEPTFTTLGRKLMAVYAQFTHQQTRWWWWWARLFFGNRQSSRRTRGWDQARSFFGEAKRFKGHHHRCMLVGSERGVVKRSLY